MLQNIKDNPNLVKDTDSGAILVKKDNSPTAIRLANLTKQVKNLESVLFYTRQHIDCVQNQNNLLNQKLEYLDCTIKMLLDKLDEVENKLNDKSS